MPQKNNNETVKDLNLNSSSSSTEKPKKKRIIPRCEETSCEKGAVSGYQFCKGH